MEKVLKIDEKEALKLYPTASKEIKSIFEATFGKDFFNQKITDRIKTMEDIIELTGFSNLPYDNPENVEEKSINAQFKLFKIAQTYNEGWKPNWGDRNEYKWFPYFYKPGSSWVVCNDWLGTLRAPSGLYFKSRELAEDVVSKFRDVFEEYFMING